MISKNAKYGKTEDVVVCEFGTGDISIQGSKKGNNGSVTLAFKTDVPRPIGVQSESEYDSFDQMKPEVVFIFNKVESIDAVICSLHDIRKEMCPSDAPTTGMRIFEFRSTRIVSGTEESVKDWVSARTIIEAIQTYMWSTGNDIFDLRESDDVVEVPRSEWGKLTVVNTEFRTEDGEEHFEMTFEDWMRTNTSSAFIASTANV